MVINFCGENCFKIQSGQLSIVSDPLPRFKGDVILHTQEFPISNPQFPMPENIIIGPGEYEIKEIEINGFPGKNQATNYLVKMEEMRLAFIGEKMDIVEPGLIEKLGEIDLLFAPAGINAKSIRQLQPKIVITSSAPKDWEQKMEKIEKLVIKKKDLAPGTKVVLLKS